MKGVSVKKSAPLRGEVEVPGDKSISHRAVILSSIAEGVSVIRNFLVAEDCLSTVDAMRASGVGIEREGRLLTVHGVGLKGLREPRDVIDAGNSGTTARLLTGLFSGQDFFSVITGDRYLRRRPMRRIVDPLTMMGAEIWGREGGEKLPLAINGRSLKGIDYRCPVASAQLKSSILLAGLTADGTTVVHEPSPSRDHTERMLLALGAPGGRRSDGGFFIEGGRPLKAAEIDVPGDISSAAFFIVAALIVEGSEVVIRGVGVNPTRTGILDILRRMGAEITLEGERTAAGEPVADIVVRSGPLKGVEIGGDVIPRAIDEIPVIAVAASVAEGTTTIRDAGELRVKESDRIRSIACELRKFGVSVEELDDGLVIEGTDRLSGADIDSHGDHRIAMAMTVAALGAEGETRIEGAQCVDISFPEFFDVIERLAH